MDNPDPPAKTSPAKASPPDPSDLSWGMARVPPAKQRLSSSNPVRPNQPQPQRSNSSRSASGQSASPHQSHSVHPTYQESLTMAKYVTSEKHSAAWIFQAWASFTISITATLLGILYSPTDTWVKGYLGMGLLFCVGSTISLSKTTRDMHESSKLLSRVDEAKLERILAEHNPFKD